MNFLSPVISGTVGQISTDSIVEIKNQYSQDTDYAYIDYVAKSDEMTYYFSYNPETTLDYPVGTFSIESNPFIFVFFFFVISIQSSCSR